MSRLRVGVALIPLLALLEGGVALADDWANWRGPNYDGSTQAEGLPIDFDQEQHVRWKAEMPGPGAATPAVFGDRVFVSSIDSEKQALVALCLDRKTGEERWRHQIDLGYLPEGTDSRTVLHRRSNYASPSPTTDGERVVFFYGIGDLVAFDLDGEYLWSRNLQEDYGDFAFQWTFSASPTLWDGRLYLPILQRDEPANGRGKPGNPSVLLAMDPGTGETLFREVRPSDANMESLESYATAIPYQGSDGRNELLVVGGDVITGHDPETGKELWRWGTWNPGHREVWWRVVPSPVVGAGVALVCAPKRAPVYAVKLGGSGELGEDGLAWRSEGKRNPVSSDVPTPLFYDGMFYVLSDVQSALSKVDPATGENEWVIEMPRRTLWRASPTGADGKIWCIDHAGLVAVIDADDGEILAEIEMGEEDDDFIRASIVVAHGDLFIRTNTTLFCIAGAAQQ